MSVARPIVSETLGVALEVLVDLIVEKCAARLGNVPPSEYTRKNLPSGMSPKRFNEMCRRLWTAGETRVKKRGGMWVAERDAIDTLPKHRARASNVVPGTYSVKRAVADAGGRDQLR